MSLWTNILHTVGLAPPARKPWKANAKAPARGDDPPSTLRVPPVRRLYGAVWVEHPHGIEHVVGRIMRWPGASAGRIVSELAQVGARIVDEKPKKPARRSR